jgi:6-aminohexanoate-oligomer endohydrolase
MPLPSNDSAILVARTEFEGASLDIDFPSLHIGVAEYEEGPTGCTVFYFPDGASCETDVRGGSPGVISFGAAHAICLAGGSAFGLEAASGVAAELFARQQFSTAWDSIPLVNAGVIFDFRTRETAVYPDKDLGRAALRAATPGRFPLGPRGAGRSASVGKTFTFYEREPGGQGGAFTRVGDLRVAVFTVLNSVGAIVDRQGRVVRGHLDAATGGRHSVVEGMERFLGDPALSQPPGGNTTLTVAVTNQKLGAWELRQFGRQVHASMARAIQPFHTSLDGDVLFAVSTDELEEALSTTFLANIASELAWDAVLSAVNNVRDDDLETQGSVGSGF